MNANLLSALKGVISYYDSALDTHDDYIDSYNRLYENGKIGNGKVWDPTTSSSGYRFELYPKSHPVLKSSSFPIIQAKVRRIWQCFYYWLSLDPADLIFEEVTKDNQYLTLMTELCLIGFLVLTYLMYDLVILRLKAIRALWLDAVRVPPIVCMGEKDTVLLLSHTDILKNIIINESLNLDMATESRLNHLEKVEFKESVKINKGSRDQPGYNGLAII